MSQRKDILINAVNLCIAQSSQHELEYRRLGEHEFYFAMRGDNIRRQQANASKRNMHALAKTYATKAVQLIRAI